VKDLLVETVTGVLGDVPWLPRTYNMETHLTSFIADFQGRLERKEDNVWIIKPWCVLIRSWERAIDCQLIQR